MKKYDLAGVEKLLPKVSASELNRLLLAIEKELEKRQAEVSLMNDFRKLASDKGVDFDRLMADVTQDIKVRREIGPAPIRFRHPKNAELVWSGRGKRPNWYKEALASGFSEEQLKVA